MAFGIEKLTHLVEKRMDALAAQIAALERKIAQMPTREEYDAGQAQLMQAVADAAARVSKDIQDLRDKLSSGVTITDADLATTQARIAEIGNIDPAAAPPGGKKS